MLLPFIYLCVAEGVKEIWLTSEDLGAYGRDIGITLPDLLYALVEEIPEGCMMRLGMTNPPYIMDYLEDIVEILNHPRVYAFLHIPVQSGSNAVLGDMRREYTRQHFLTVFHTLQKGVTGGATIATDVICGFPTEGVEDFEETLQLVRDCRFPVLFINQYYPRPNTPAARMKRLDTIEVKRRTKAVSDLFASYFPYEGRKGSLCRILITEEASDGKHLVGHSKAYEQVLVAKREFLRGKTIDCRIVETGKHFMMGDPLWRDYYVEKLRYYSGSLVVNVMQLLTLDNAILTLGIGGLTVFFVTRFRK